MQVSGREGPAAGRAGAEAAGGREQGRRVRGGAWRAAGPGPCREDEGAGADPVRADAVGQGCGRGVGVSCRDRGMKILFH